MISRIWMYGPVVTRREWFGPRPSANALLTEALPGYILGAIKKSSGAFAMALF
jgi:hypothetical protein